MSLFKPALTTLLVLAAGAAQASVHIDVVFDDPTGSFASYYSDIARVTIAAGDAWGASFQSLSTDVDLMVRIGFTSISTAAGRSLAAAYTGTGSDGIDLYQQGAAYKLMTGFDTNGGAADIEFAFGIDGYLQHELWFDPAPALRQAAVPLDRTDAMSVLLHEFGHALGFNGWRDGSTGALPGNYQSSFDALVGAGSGPQGTALYFGGAQASGLYGAALPLTWDRYGHLGNSAVVSGADLIPDLMNGVAFYRGTRYAISGLDLAVMQDLGLPMTMMTAVPEPGSTVLWLAGLSVLALLRWRRPPVPGLGAGARTSRTPRGADAAARRGSASAAADSGATARTARPGRGPGTSGADTRTAAWPRPVS